MTFDVVMDVVLKAFLGTCGAGILTLICIVIKWFVKKIKADDLTIDALAHDAYFRHCRYLLPLESISEVEYENHEFLYKAYKAQGLNGTGDRMHELISQKEIVPNSIDRMQDV